jgi:hypothetical protein
VIRTGTLGHRLGEGPHWLTPFFHITVVKTPIGLPTEGAVFIHSLEAEKKNKVDPKEEDVMKKRKKSEIWYNAIDERCAALNEINFFLKGLINQAIETDSDRYCNDPNAATGISRCLSCRRYKALLINSNDGK